MKIKKLTAAIGVFAFLASLGFASGYNLYSEASEKSKVITTIDEKTQGEYIRFYTDKDGKWAKYANTQTGETGWVDLGQIEIEKANVLRQQLLDDLNLQMKQHNEQISALAELKNKINKANYEELQQYRCPNRTAVVKFLQAVTG